jgi:hypothetical protein
MSSQEHGIDGQNPLTNAELNEVGSVLSPQAKETLSPEASSSVMMRPIPPALCAIPTGLSGMIREYAEMGMKDPATRVLLERARDWQAAELTLCAQADQSAALPDCDADDPDDVSASFQLLSY